MDKISNVIKWANFPENVVSDRGHRMGEVFEVSFPSNYESNVKYVHDLGRLLKVSLITGTILLGVDQTVFAAGTSLDTKMTSLYYGKFIGIAQIIIAGKGGFDTIAKVLRDDFDGAKKGFMQYLLAFSVLMGLPKALDFIETLFLT
jgi:hypothetical protein